MAGAGMLPPRSTPPVPPSPARAKHINPDILRLKHTPAREARDFLLQIGTSLPQHPNLIPQRGVLARDSACGGLNFRRGLDAMGLILVDPLFEVVDIVLSPGARGSLVERVAIQCRLACHGRRFGRDFDATRRGSSLG